MSGPALQLTILGEALRLAAPRALWALALVALLGLLGAWAIVRRRRDLRGLVGPLAGRVAPGAGVARPVVRLGAQLLGLSLLALALSRPQCGSRAELSKRYGIDLVVALDVSRSMLARDEKPDRLTRAKLEVSALLDRLQGDRVAVVLFAADAFVQCPLTTDYAAARLLLRAAGPDALPRQGTSLGGALATAGEVLQATERAGRSRAVVMLSDGEGHEPGVEAAVERLSADGVRLFTVGLGSPDGAPVPVTLRDGSVSGYRKQRDGSPVVTRLEEGALRALAEKTGGRYFRATGAVGLPELAEELSRMEKSEIEGRTTVTWEERYAFLAFPGFLALLGAGLFRERPRRLPAPDGEAAP